MTAHDLHTAAKPGGKFERPNQTWWTRTRIVNTKGQQSLEGEANYLVTEIRGNDHTPAAPWRVTIDRDFYESQCWVRVYRWKESHLGGGTYGDWTLVTTVPIVTLPIFKHATCAKDGLWQHDMGVSLDLALMEGLVALGLI